MSRESVKTLAAKRVRRQKIFIAVGSVLLLAILGFELPKVMGGKGGTEAVATTTAPAPGAPAGAAPVVPAAKLPDTDQVAVVRDSNQLISFGLFKTKDPFVQQLSTTPEGPAPSSAPTPIPAPTGPTATPPGGTGGGSTPLTPAVVPPGVIGTPAPPTGSPGSTVTTPGATTPSAPVPAPTDALIATNGVCERVSVKGTFPTDENIFRLASVAKDGKSVEVGIVGGSFDNGHPTAPLKVGEKITLVNTADGTRYEIVLKTSCSVIATAGSTTQSTTTTPIAPAPTTTTPVDTAPATTTTTTTTTATTPIVTDSLDTTTPTG